MDESVASGSSELKIVPYKPSDIDELMEIENDSFRTPWSRKSYKELAALHNVEIWVARSGHELVGYMLLQYVGDEMEMHTFAVKHGYRRKGIGSRLLDHMVSQGRQHGVEKVYLLVRQSNTVAKALYESVGFVTVGIRHAYYCDNRENALVMMLELPPLAKG